ncbi:MAG: DMT family transporter [Propionibacteriaceae bacterium]|jgi:drug/metabolite transporter (DMT)-like permease|nr:DMT family transporter [Propionibacteriaceae bacterium]
MSQALRSTLLLALASIIWGFAFVAQRLGMDHIGPFLFNGLRCLLGALTVWTVVCLRERRVAPLLRDAPRWRHAWRLSPTLRGGILCGLALCAGSNLQQVGLVDVDAGKAGFLTALYIVLVPLAGLLFRQRVRWTVWPAVGLAVVGLYLLCLTEQLSIARGDVIVLLGAVGWTVQILLIDRYVKVSDVFRLCAIEFLTAGVISLAIAPFADRAFVTATAGLAASLWAALPALLFAGVLSSGVAFTAQALGQRTAPPALASLIMSLEAPFATLAGFTVLHESFTPREGVGCVLMFAAVLVAQAPSRSERAARPVQAGG